MRVVLVCVAILALGVSEAAATGPVLNHCFFTWNYVALADLDSFNVYLGAVSGGPYVRIGSVPGTPGVAKSYGPTTNLCGGQPDGQKFAIVRAVDTASNEGPASNEIPFAFDATAPPGVNDLGVR